MTTFGIEKQEKTVIWDYAVNQMIQHLEGLKNYSLTYAELLNIMEIMADFYKKEDALYKNTHNQIRKSITNLRLTVDATLNFIRGLTGNLNIPALHQPYTNSFLNTSVVKIYELVKEILKNKMDSYRSLQGTPHPRWEELSKMQFSGQ